MKTNLPLCLLVCLFTSGARLCAADATFSGPQQGEKTTPFKVVELTGANVGKERDPVAENAGQPTALLFVHGIERSLVPLLRVVDEYGAGKKDALKTEIVFLSADRLEGEQRVKAAAGSLKLQSRVGLSLDGIEGPGNYGLNKECLMTLIVAKDNAVTANFALVQPGIADAPKVLEALAKACGDANPPTVEQLNERSTARNGGGREGAPMRPAARAASFDLNTEAGLREAVRALQAEVQSLRAEVAALRGAPARPAANADRPKEEIPGAVPTDETLTGLLRRFIRPANDEAAVEKVLAEVREHIKDNAGLRKQAIDGWTRVLHFEHYGTEYSRKTGRAFLNELIQQAK